MDTPELRILNIALTDADWAIQKRTFSDIWRDVDYISFESLNEGLALLLQKGIYKDQPRPDVVFVEMEDTEEATLAFLKAVKDKPKLRNVPVILLVHDKANLNLGQELEFMSHMALEHPLSRTQLRNLAQQLVDFWMGFQEFAVIEGEDEPQS